MYASAGIRLGAWYDVCLVTMLPDVKQSGERESELTNLSESYSEG